MPVLYNNRQEVETLFHMCNLRYNDCHIGQDTPMLHVLVKLDVVTPLLSSPRQITFRLYSCCHELHLFLLQSELTIYIHVTYITCRESIKPPHSECKQVAISSLG